MNFAWSFKPFFILFTTIIGIDLDISKERSKCRSCLIVFFSVFWLVFFNISMCISNIVIGIQKDFSNTSLTTEMNQKLTYIAPVVLATLFHISLLLSKFGKWNSLWAKLQRIQDQIKDDRMFFRQQRRDAIIGTIIIIVVNLFTLRVI